MPWEPFDPASYYLHVVAGVTAAVAGLVALTSLKGSKRHIFAGRVFAGCMIVAAATTMVFMLSTPVGIAAFGALFVIYLLGTAVAALRRTPDGKTMLERVMLAWGGGLIVLLGRMMWLNRLDHAERIPVLGVFVVIVVGLLVSDLRYLSVAAPSRRDAVRRHLVRMCFAFAVAMQAAAVTNLSRLGIGIGFAILGPFVVMGAVAAFFWRRHGGVGRSRGGIAVR